MEDASVYWGSFFCELCDQQLPFQVYGAEAPLSAEQIRQAMHEMSHHHWCDRHQVCVVCGRRLASAEIKLVMNRGIPIHSAYTDRYRKVDPNDRSTMLMVHRQCLPPHLKLVARGLPDPDTD